MKTCQLVFHDHDVERCRFQARKTETAGERMRGLLFAPPLAENEALLISPCNSVHSFLMHYDIDVVYINKQNEVSHLVSMLKPWRASAHLRASHVVELAAGQINQYGIQLGDRCTCL